MITITINEKILVFFPLSLWFWWKSNFFLFFLLFICCCFEIDCCPASNFVLEPNRYMLSSYPINLFFHHHHSLPPISDVPRRVSIAPIELQRIEFDLIEPRFEIEPLQAYSNFGFIQKYYNRLFIVPLCSSRQDEDTTSNSDTNCHRTLTHTRLPIGAWDLLAATLRHARLNLDNEWSSLTQAPKRRINIHVILHVIATSSKEYTQNILSVW